MQRRAMPSAAAALGLLPALALACVLASNWAAGGAPMNWAAGGAPMEALQVRGGEPLLVDIEPDAMRVVGELVEDDGAAGSGADRRGTHWDGSPDLGDKYDHLGAASRGALQFGNLLMGRVGINSHPRKSGF